MSAAEFLSDWLSLCADLHVSEAAGRRAFDRLTAAYASPGREYHTLGHAGQVLHRLLPLRASARDFVALQFAAWFHDAVYDAQAKDNEERSAELAAEVLGDMGVGPEVLAEVRRLILLTMTHDPADRDADGCLLVDADLAVLGAAPDEYQRYAAGIRQEYAWVPDEAYRTGRRAVLESFLRRPCIYRSPALRSLEEQARQNLTAEIQALGRPEG